MPFKSKAQRRYMYANKVLTPEQLKEWQSKTPKKLPEKVAFEIRKQILKGAKK